VLCCDAESPRRLCREAAAEPMGEHRRAQRVSHRDPQPAAGRKRRHALSLLRSRRLAESPGGA
jgi:hypothetical protein